MVTHPTLGDWVAALWFLSLVFLWVTQGHAGYNFLGLDYYWAGLMQGTVLIAWCWPAMRRIWSWLAWKIATRRAANG